MLLVLLLLKYVKADSVYLGFVFEDYILGKASLIFFRILKIT